MSGLERPESSQIAKEHWAVTEELADHNRAELNFNFYHQNQERENNKLGRVKWSQTEAIKGGCTEIYLHLIADEGAVLRKAFCQFLIFNSK